MRIFPVTIALLTVALTLTVNSARAENPAVREFRIEPATTGVPLGRAKLSVEPLTRADGKGKADSFRAAYKVEVFPFTLASEEGTLTITLTAEMLGRLADGQPVEFTGQAVSTSGNNSTLRGTATPTKDATDTGAIRVRIESRKGKLVFNTSYRLVR
jgi:hypothetical protein